MYIKKLLLIIALLGLVGLGIFSYFIYTAIFSPNTSFEKDEIYVYVSNDRSYGEVLEQLQSQLKDVESFDVVARKKGYPNNVKPGRFRITKGMNNNEIINSLRSANIPLRLSFNNQETPELLAGRIAGQLEADSVSLLETITDTAFLKENGLQLETALALYIPNTYEFYWNTSAEAFRKRMLKEYRSFWNTERMAKAEALDLSPEEVVTLAAIVQKETVKVDERPRVAGVYVNRLKRGMRLQADPTVIYAIKKETGNFDTIIKRVLYKDLETESPYNTYKYAGLPPGPIAMPDISSIDAVLGYEKHDFLYFVSDTENPGYHLFAKSLAAHNRNKQKYVQWVNKLGLKR